MHQHDGAEDSSKEAPDRNEPEGVKDVSGDKGHESGRAKEAIALYQGALARTPDDAEIHYNLALALEDTAGAPAAIAEYEGALALDPNFADAHWNLAGLLEAGGEKAAALRHYQAYAKLTR